MKPSVLPPGLRVVGDIEGEEDFVVFGTVEGDVHLAGHLTVESGGTVRGKVDVRALTVRGVVVGDATAIETIRVDSGGKVVGDVRAPRVHVVDGAMMRGRVEIVGAPPPPSMRDRRVRNTDVVSAPPLAMASSSGSFAPMEDMLSTDAERDPLDWHERHVATDAGRTAAVTTDTSPSVSMLAIEAPIAAAVLAATTSSGATAAASMATSTGEERPPAPAFPYLGRQRARRRN